MVTGGGAIPSGGPAPRGNEVEADRARRTARDFEGVFLRMPVSYTHLTLPTILRV